MYYRLEICSAHSLYVEVSFTCKSLKTPLCRCSRNKWQRCHVENGISIFVCGNFARSLGNNVCVCIPCVEIVILVVDSDEEQQVWCWSCRLGLT